MRKLLLCIILLVCFTGCYQQANDAVKLAANTLDISTQVDVFQEDLGQYSNNQDALASCDELQSNIRLAMAGDISKLQLSKYRSDAAIIYSVMKQEIISRWDEISPLQREQIYQLEQDYLQADQLAESTFKTTLKSGTAKEVLSFLTSAAKIYVSYKEAK